MSAAAAIPGTLLVDDGRNVDTSRGELSGEAATLRIDRPEDAYPTTKALERRVPSERPIEVEGYYGQPILKPPVWIWSIPAYFFVGGAAGGAATLAAAAEALDGRRLRRLIRRAHAVSAIGDVLGARLLIHDLGRPLRFLNMLRVFRPTSPMSVGSWVLSASGASSALAVLLRDRPVGKVAGYASGLLGLPLAGYTAVLLTNTAVPVWLGGARALPPLFLASSAASAGALLDLLPTGARGRRVARRFALFGTVATLGLGAVYEAEVGSVPRAAEPLRRGRSGGLWALARVLTSASLVALVAARGRRRAARLGDALGLAGALALRTAVFMAGKASARDPEASFAQQAGSRG